MLANVKCRATLLLATTCRSLRCRNGGRRHLPSNRLITQPGAKSFPIELRRADEETYSISTKSTRTAYDAGRAKADGNREHDRRTDMQNRKLDATVIIARVKRVLQIFDRRRGPVTGRSSIKNRRCKSLIVRRDAERVNSNNASPPPNGSGEPGNSSYRWVGSSPTRVKSTSLSTGSRTTTGPKSPRRKDFLQAMNDIMVSYPVGLSTGGAAKFSTMPYFAKTGQAAVCRCRSERRKSKDHPW